MISGSQFRLYLNCMQTISISGRLLHNLGMQPVKLDGCRSGGFSIPAETLASCLSLKKTLCSSQHMPIHIWYNISKYSNALSEPQSTLEHPFIYHVVSQGHKAARLCVIFVFSISLNLEHVQVFAVSNRVSEGRRNVFFPFGNFFYFCFVVHTCLIPMWAWW